VGYLLYTKKNSSPPKTDSKRLLTHQRHISDGIEGYELVEAELAVQVVDRHMGEGPVLPIDAAHHLCVWKEKAEV
jgi:hypothetical protein